VFAHSLGRVRRHTAIPCIAQLEVIARPGCIRSCSPPHNLPISFAVPKEFKSRLVQHLAVKIHVCFFAGLSPRRWSQTGSVHTLPQSPSLLSNLDNGILWYGRTVCVFQIWVLIFITFRLSSLATSLLLGCQTIRFASRGIAIYLERLGSPEAYLMVVFWV
jgi:hypothetical protein